MQTGRARAARPATRVQPVLGSPLMTILVLPAELPCFGDTLVIARSVMAAVAYAHAHARKRRLLVQRLIGFTSRLNS
jgi:hypothetical protein